MSFGLLNVPPVHFEMPLCAVHYRRRIWGQVIVFILVIITILAAVIAVACRERPETGFYYTAISVCIVGSLSAILVAIRGDYQPRIHNFAGGYYYLKGCGPAFLEQIPSVPGDAYC